MLLRTYFEKIFQENVSNIPNRKIRRLAKVVDEILPNLNTIFLLKGNLGMVKPFFLSF